MQKKFIAWENRRGFTLLELLVVIAIIGITSSVVLVSLGHEKTQSDISNEAHRVAAIIRQTQNYSLTGKVLSEVERPSDYAVVFNSSTDSYFVLYGYVLATPPAIAKKKILATYTLQNGVQFSNMTIPSNIRFTPPRGDNSIPRSGFLIGLTKGSQTVYVCVTQVGQIIEKGADPSCP